MQLITDTVGWTFVVGEISSILSRKIEGDWRILKIKGNWKVLVMNIVILRYKEEVIRQERERILREHLQ